MQRKSQSARRLAGKQLRYEPLEPRLALAAAGLVDVGAQPEGALSGKVVYTSGGHGIVANNLTSGSWGFQRPLLLNMIEDLGNQDQLTSFAEYAFNAGATVVPMRPVGHQVNEIILDNDDVEVTFTGNWNDSTDTVYFGSAGDVPYRFATSSATETAVATYRPNVTEAGFYPVYAWTTAGAEPRVRPTLSRQPLGRQHGSHHQPPHGRHGARVLGDVPFRSGHRRLGRDQQPLHRRPQSHRGGYDPVRKRRGRHQPRRGDFRTQSRRRSQRVLVPMARRSLSGRADFVLPHFFGRRHAPTWGAPSAMPAT